MVPGEATSTHLVLKDSIGPLFYRKLLKLWAANEPVRNFLSPLLVVQ